MPETRGSVRQRKKAAQAAGEPVVEPTPAESSATEEAEEEVIPEPKPKPKPTPKARLQTEDEDQDGYTPWLDILRVITFLLLASASLSYLISSGESFTWGMKHPPKYMQMNWWKSHFASPLHLTLEELAQFDGRNPESPIYLAINGTIYDVSANRRTYGPGGSYNIFAGVDASRGFVTGCFADDRTADLRGVEEMFLPVDDPAFDNKHLNVAQLAEIKRVEREEAERKVFEALEHWANFFARSDKYHKVGTVKREPDWLEKEPRKKLCDAAQQQRPKRKVPGQ
ncbi:heme steroid binding domain-containing protein [Apiospora phragmitis]|uniref:Heme steroid binding domain-containing protein n=1 Tax=Apiospora phragmitis TaxID=2905665 RepID=A0ABR1WT98_9PEZI